jgi:hypothetical protein
VIVRAAALRAWSADTRRRSHCRRRLHRKAARKVERERRQVEAERAAARAKKRAKEAEYKKWKAMQKAMGLWVPDPNDPDDAEEEDNFFGSSLLHGDVGGEGETKDGDGTQESAADDADDSKSQHSEGSAASTVYSHMSVNMEQSILSVFGNAVAAKLTEVFVPDPLADIPFDDDEEARMPDGKRWWEVCRVLSPTLSL